MSHFCLLKDPETYSPQDWDLLEDAPAREYWLAHFSEGFAEAMKYASQQYGREAEKRIDAASKQFNEMIRTLRENPKALPGGKLGVLDLDLLRESVLRQRGLHDPYADLKIQADALAEKLYPQVVRKLHAMDDEEKWLHLVECVFAGNLFDLGARSEMNPGRDPEDFLSVAAETKPRPWLIDDYDELAEDLLSAPPMKWAKAVAFLDNSGPDFVLGVMPLARELALHGTKVVLAANEGPALNDVTVEEVIDVVERLAVADSEVAAMINAEMFEVVSTGSRIPLLDLREVSDELNEAAADAELVILEGMGRAVETNFDTAFKVDRLSLALLKNSQVAARIGGEMYDCVCKYVRSGSES